ncbi:MAG: PBSX family phage terminase large subunit [Acutalibacteraceae bacterium]
MKFEKISAKQKNVLEFPFKFKEYDALICDGAVRSGKTVFMIISFLIWAMRNYDEKSFGICGKTVASTERNIIQILGGIDILTAFFKFHYIGSKHILTVSGFGHVNNFYVFGGKDESSYMLIQGITLSGVFFDEVALQPKSFVEQAIARTITEPHAKLYFNCNPEHPEHWFYKEWILDADGENTKNSLHLHFLMNDNPILTDEDIKKAESRWQGVFRDRYIYGLWVMAEGLVYPDAKAAVVDYKEMYDTLHDRFYIVGSDGKKNYGKYYMSIDYGTNNPFSAGLWFVSLNFAVRVKEFYYDSKKTGKQKTDEEYYSDIEKLAGQRPIENIVVDPSAASFIQTIRRHNKYPVIKAKNDVLDGIRVVSCFLDSKSIRINSKCSDAIREFSLYRWDEESNEDKVLKEYDHSMDDIRYFCNTILKEIPPFCGEIKDKVRNNVIFKQINTSWK